MKRAALCVLIAVSLFLSGCSVLDGTSLLMLPEISPDQAKLLQLVNCVTANSSWTVTAPSRGDDLSTMHFVDFFSDGVSEAVSFFRNAAEMLIRVTVYSNTGGTGYTELCSVETEGYGIDSVEYSDIDGDGALELLLFVRYESGAICGAEIYGISNKTAEGTFLGTCMSYAVCDLTLDGQDDIILYRGGGGGTAVSNAYVPAGESSYAELFSWEKEAIASLGTAPASGGAAEIGAPVCGMLNKKMAGCVFDVTVSTGDGEIYLSDVLTWTRSRGFENLSYSAQWGCAYETVRDLRLFCRDADFDGFLEIPQCVAMPSSEVTAGSGDPEKYTFWYGYSADGTLAQKNVTYCFPGGNWYFIMPTSWSGTVYVRTGSMEDLTTLTFAADRNGRPNRLLTIYRTASATELSLPEDVFHVTDAGGFSYYALIGVPDTLSPLENEMYMSGVAEVMQRFVTVDTFGNASRAMKYGN